MMEIEAPTTEERFHWDVVLRNGTTVHITNLTSGDGERLRRFVATLSPESRYDRFFAFRDTDRIVQELMLADDRRLALIAESGGEIIAVAHYYNMKEVRSAEVAFAVSDAHHSEGIGTRLLERLSEVAQQRGITTFVALVLPHNQKMLQVFIDSGYQVKRRLEDGVYEVTFSIVPTPESNAKLADHNIVAAAASMRPIFEPQSIAVIGASEARGNLGRELLENLVTSQFHGRLFVVNPKHDQIGGVPSYPNVRDIPADIDLGVIVVPAAAVESVVDDCIAKRVRALVIITAGFGELGEEGRIVEARLVEKIRTAGIRMVGPNCMGVINTDPDVRMQATFTNVRPPVGTLAMSSQSGALGLAILDYARSLDLGFSTFISVGNKADVSGNDLIQYWAQDGRTEVILLYLESFGNPRRFRDIATNVSRRKPIVAVKSGRSGAGARAASSHTGALATSDALVDDLLRQTGVIRTDTIEELFDVASILARQPLPPGRRVAIVTNAGGPGILAADACEANGLQLAQLSNETVEGLRSFLPAAASVRNPVDMIASASAADYARSLDLVLKDPGVDAVVVIYIPVLPTHAAEVANALRNSVPAAAGVKPIVATFMSAAAAGITLAPVPAFPFPERAVRALGRAATYAEFRRRPDIAVRRYDDFDEVAIRTIVDTRISSGGGWLDPDDVVAMLRSCRLSTPELITVSTAEEAMKAAMKIGFPVVLKATGPTLLHKSDRGGVALSLASEGDVLSAYTTMKEALGEEMQGAFVQSMIRGGAEVMIGAVDDPSFGHVVLYGAGGTMVELLADVAFRVQPITATDADDMVQEVRYSKVLAGFRGKPAADRKALREALLRLSHLLTVAPEIVELDINPLKVLPSGAIAVDARIRVEQREKAASRRVTY